MTDDAWFDEIEEEKKNIRIEEITKEILKTGCEILSELSKWGDFQCERCGAVIFKKARANNNQKYCRDCAIEVKKIQHRELMRRQKK